jgi:hypothetical protein
MASAAQATPEFRVLLAQRSSQTAVADMRRVRRVQHLDWLEAEGLDAVEQPLAWVSTNTGA